MKYNSNSMFAGIVIGVFIGVWLIVLIVGRSGIDMELIKSAWYRGYVAAQERTTVKLEGGTLIEIGDAWKKDSVEILKLLKFK